MQVLAASGKYEAVCLNSVAVQSEKGHVREILAV